MVDKILEKLATPAFWRGVIYVSTAAGIQISPFNQELIMSAGLGAVGVLHLVFAKKNAQ